MKLPSSHLPTQDLETPILLEYAGTFGFGAGTALKAADEAPTTVEREASRRNHLRNPVEACRPIALQMLDDQNHPTSA
ncbi:MAG: hypothetical protein ACOVNL_03565 [Prochlorococcaceae cyanobacterium]|jgi:hypothetical protein